MERNVFECIPEILFYATSTTPTISTKPTAININLTVNVPTTIPSTTQTIIAATTVIILAVLGFVLAVYKICKTKNSTTTDTPNAPPEPDIAFHEFIFQLLQTLFQIRGN